MYVVVTPLDGHGLDSNLPQGVASVADSVGSGSAVFGAEGGQFPEGGVGPAVDIEGIGLREQS